jgi:translation initiation factor 2 beta subunit (eIF-2beta)/eIF-5
VEINGRSYVKCPRCDSINTISFRQLKEGGEEAQLWGLEQIAKAHPRSVFEVKRSA